MDKDKVRDGRHRRVTEVEVTPLQPPFGEGVRFIKFADGEKTLALSREDAEAVESLLGKLSPGRTLTLSEGSQDDKIKITINS